MHTLTARSISLLVLAAAALLGGCSKRVVVMVPPEFDLGRYEAIGVVEFSGRDAYLSAEATRQFREQALSAQPGVRLIEIDGGPEGAALSSSGRIDAAAVAALADRFAVDAIFLGNLEVSEVKPRIDLAVSLIEMRATAEVHATLSARLVEAAGATVWSRSARDTASVAHMRASSNGSGHVGIADPSAKYADLVQGLTAHVASPLWPRYVRRKAKDVPPHYIVTYPDGVAVYAPPEAVTEVP